MSTDSHKYNSKQVKRQEQRVTFDSLLKSRATFTESIMRLQCRDYTDVQDWRNTDSFPLSESASVIMDFESCSLQTQTICYPYFQWLLHSTMALFDDAIAEELKEEVFFLFALCFVEADRTFGMTHCFSFLLCFPFSLNSSIYPQLP